jgi:uncharacterized protein
MRIMVDTNVVISALLKQGSVPDIVLFDVCENHELILCDQIINESYDVARRRFPNKLDTLEKFFTDLRYELVSSPKTGNIQMIDVKDQPILNAAITHKLDILITGDRHFLELDLEIPQIITPSEYKIRYIDNHYV